MDSRPSPPQGISRRRFIQAAAVPLLAPRRFFGAEAPGNRIRVGHIGCGRIGQGHDMPGVALSGLADVLAVCDLDSRRVASGRIRIAELYRDRKGPRPEVRMYGDYRELLARSDIDAVIISTPDHWHAQLAIAAVDAGKDVYLQKPVTFTHAEGVLLRATVARTGRIVQVGSQQRSWAPHEQFRHACEFVRSGRVGRLTGVEIGLPIDPTAPDAPEQPVPPNLNYDEWLGPTEKAYYTEQRVHPQATDPATGGPDVVSRPGWLRHEATCLGMITGWGAHHLDTAHWGMNTELGGPIRAEGRGDFPANKIWNVHGAYHVELTYPGDVRMVISDKFQNGIKFIGDEGWIFVCRDAGATASDPNYSGGPLKSLDASKPALLDPRGVSVHFPHSLSHHRNWLECVKSRATPLSPVTIAHRANAACIVSWIAMKLGRPLNWDPKAERFAGDSQANAMLTRSERAPYGAFRMPA